jgi:tRNA uridine 5-carbamoylmethylation protein Kti12
MNRFVVITGLPGSGKSTVGAAVAEALALPLLDKDDILEALFEALGVGDANWRGRLSRAADEVLQRLAFRSRGAVIASWWQHPLSHIASGTSPSWLRSLPGEVIELHCKCSPRIAAERFFARQRHAGHLDSSKSEPEELAKFQQFASQGALGIGRVVEVNTEQQLELGALLNQLERSASREQTRRE